VYPHGDDRSPKDDGDSYFGMLLEQSHGILWYWSSRVPIRDTTVFLRLRRNRIHTYDRRRSVSFIVHRIRGRR
jgi:hypothetical protein